jgi:hypothetical protein
MHSFNLVSNTYKCKKNILVIHSECVYIIKVMRLRMRLARNVAHAGELRDEYTDLFGICKREDDTFIGSGRGQQLTLPVPEFVGRKQNRKK